jgi:hypothetical protein
MTFSSKRMDKNSILLQLRNALSETYCRQLWRQRVCIYYEFRGKELSSTITIIFPDREKFIRQQAEKIMSFQPTHLCIVQNGEEISFLMS